ncbi:CheR family methyltransferase [Microbacterium sp.]|uniref:CheR family methyltransferase n=1 Tax=Microbacterium sp. TaxID=51671 RepID=UPI0039E2F91A
MDARTKYTQAAIAAGGIWLWSAAHAAWGRDSEMWPGLLELIPETGTVWCAGVATGEEALTLAARTPDTVSIVASDVMLPALKTAWEGAYPRGMVAAAVEAGDITRDEAARIFADYDEAGEWLHVDEAISARIRWWPHDLVEHSPLTSVDVVLCRNVLTSIPRQDRAGVVDRLAQMGVPVVVGTSDLLHAGREWLARFAPADRVFVLRPDKAASRT